MRALIFLFYLSTMLNCYKPLAAPAQDDGKSKRRDRDGQAPNGHSIATKQPDLASATREDGRTPYDMRQVGVYMLLT